MAETEAGFRRDVTAVLNEVGAEYRRSLRTSTELVAAQFSVASIARLWDQHVPRLLRSLRGILRRGAADGERQVGRSTPNGFDPALAAGDWEQQTRAQLAGIGSRMSRAAAQSLAEGMNAGEDQAQLRDRMLDLFSASGAQLGPARAAMIAQTQSTGAYAAGVLAAANELSSEERPLVKQWRNIFPPDDRIREPHADADGQLQLLAEPFDVGGTAMLYPGDPTAPADLVIGCRCSLELSERRTASLVAALPVDLGAAAVTEHTGAMIALIPREEDADRLALPGGEPASELHLTLFYLGEAADWDDAIREKLIAGIARWAPTTPVYANAFGVNHWNPNGDSPCWVWAVGDDRDAPDSPSLQAAHDTAYWALVDLNDPTELPVQHSPWSPHVAGAYSADGAPFEPMVDRTGPIVFDRIRVAFAGEYADIWLQPDDDAEPLSDVAPDEVTIEPSAIEGTASVPWTTPDDAALAYENQETGDGRIFAPDALHWDAGPWPLQFADEMLEGHSGAELAGVIDSMERDGDRITGEGSLYLFRSAGWEAAQLLAQGAPLGVSVDLDNVSVEFVDHTDRVYDLAASSASVLRTGDGWIVTLSEPEQWAAAGTSLVASSTVRRFVLGDDCTVPRTALTAAAGDPDRDGTVVHTESTGDMTMRITKGRIRGATLVTIPAYSAARIVLDPAPPGYPPLVASGADTALLVSDHITAASGPVTVSGTATATGLTVVTVRNHLAEAVEGGTVVRISRGSYLPANITAAASGSTDYPLADRGTAWNSTAAAGRVLAWADGDADKLGSAYLWQDPDGDPATASAYKLGHVDIVDGEPVIVPRAVFAVAGALQGARGGVDIPEADVAGVKAKVDALYKRISEQPEGEVAPPWESGDMSASADRESITWPGGDDEVDDELTASAWAAMRDLPPMPAEWFREPTAEELPPGGPGMNYANGRVYGWVAQAGEPHAGYAQKITIDTLGRIDTTHFLRQRFKLDDGSDVKAGAFTMNTGHHRDGAECETGACAFDDSRTVAAIVTVGMNAGGMWFSGAAHPALSEWDLRVFAALQPSYHMRQAPSGGWQLRGVLAVPVPGHSSPLLTAAVIERTNMALTASAALARPVVLEQEVPLDQLPAELVAAPVETVVTTLSLEAVDLDYRRLADEIVASMARATEQQERDAAELAEFAASLGDLPLGDPSVSDMLDTTDVGDTSKGRG